MNKLGLYITNLMLTIRDTEEKGFTRELALEQLKQLKGSLTIIIISHHKNILKHCDKIYKIENKKLNLLKEEKLIQESLK